MTIDLEIDDQPRCIAQAAASTTAAAPEVVEALRLAAARTPRSSQPSWPPLR